LVAGIGRIRKGVLFFRSSYLYWKAIGKWKLVLLSMIVLIQE
jgi:hypothetical protein